MSTGSWLAVVIAASIIACVVGVLITLPVWTRGAGRRLVPALLTAQAGGVIVVGAIAVAAAIRSWQLLGRPTAPVTRSLVTVSRIDGDGRMFALIILTVVAMASLSALLLVLAARFAAGDDPTERTIASAVLGLEVALCGYGLAACLGGSRSAPALVAAVNLPLAMAAMVACWPARTFDGLASPEAP